MGFFDGVRVIGLYLTNIIKIVNKENMNLQWVDEISREEQQKKNMTVLKLLNGFNIEVETNMHIFQFSLLQAEDFSAPTWNDIYVFKLKCIHKQVILFCLYIMQI